MAYSVSQDFTNKLYSGSSQFKATLIIGEEEIPNSQISSISISSPIIDTSSDYFYVGSFISQKITIKFKNLDDYEFHSGEEVSLSISQYVNNQWIEVPIGKYLIDDLAENYHKTCEITCMDYAIKFKPNIDYSPCFVNNRATIGTILQYICSQFGVELGVYPLTNDDVVVATYNNTVSGKQWISYIAELKGCNAKIDRTGKLTFKPLTTTATTTINAKKGSSLELGELYKISKVTFTDAIRNFTYGTDTNNTLYIRQDNPFINDTSVVENIYDVVKDFEIYNINTKNFGDFTLDAWDIIEYQVGEDTYKTINDNTITYAMSIMSEVNVSIPTKQQEVTTNVIEPNLKTVSTTVDNVNKSVNIAIAEIGDRTGKTTSLTQDITHIEGLISEVVDITTSGESQIASVTLDDEVNESQPIEVRIQPILDNVSYLYPNNELYPSDTLFIKTRTLVFQNTDTDEQFTWELPTDLWIYDSEIYDSLNLSYGSSGNPTVTVTRKCKANADGTISVLDEPTVETYDYPSYLNLTDGHYTVYLLGYNSAYLYVRLMAKNIYTDQFYTKAETEVRLTETATGIEANVNATLTNDYYDKQSVDGKLALKLGKNEYGQLISMLNASADEITLAGGSKINLTTAGKLLISAGNFKLDANGNITANGGKIAKWDITEDGLSCVYNQYKYTIADYERALDIYLGKIQGTPQDIEKYDIDGNGKITLLDCTKIMHMANFDEGYDNPIVGTTSTTYNYNGITFDNTGTLSYEEYKFKNNIKYDMIQLVADNYYGEGTHYSSYMTPYAISTNELTCKSIYVNDGNYWLNPSTSNKLNGLILTDNLTMNNNQISSVSSLSATYIYGDDIYGRLHDTSLAEKKKNIKPLKDKALDIINKTDIYTYNFKDDKDNHKYIGFVIGDGYKYADELVGYNNEGKPIGANTYSMASVSFKAIQELKEIIDNQQTQINELKEEIQKMKESDK